MIRNDFEKAVLQYGCEIKDEYVYYQGERIAEFTEFWFQYRSKTEFYQTISGEQTNVGVLKTYKFKDIDLDTFKNWLKDFIENLNKEI